MSPIPSPPDDLEICYNWDKLEVKFGLTHAQAFYLSTFVRWHREQLLDALIGVRIWKKISNPTAKDAQDFRKSLFTDNPLQEYVRYKVGGGAESVAMKNLAKKGFIEIKHVTYEKDFPEIFPAMQRLMKPAKLKKGFHIWIPVWEGFHNRIEELI